ncbi:phospholipase D family protein [Hymenobacter sp. BT770]|uniref:phospholipase D family protein n=1 Tax=Hymenobacter sp. BT770 TaxID=2886942 RepID=UPI001D1288CC|nr:phospholipase D family protein [Hymenobacter sp. BT770]MCC3154614.1 phospholipase D family protein [Hymenobacter sp. BT770]MDO3416668.1 phospholipase D family protein [Hymenobacter sp. BT770]
MHLLLGEQLESLCKNAIDEVLLVAPFVKGHILQRLLGCIEPKVAVRIVTRWNPLEIQAGVSDLGVWPLIDGRENSSLYLCSHLHAKYFRADKTCLIGSANLTGRALGWSKQANLELLVKLNSQSSGLPDFEEAVILNSALVDESVYQKTKDAVNSLPENFMLFSTEGSKYDEAGDQEGASSLKVFLPTEWLPVTRFPDVLFKAYSGDISNLSQASKEMASLDLAFLGIPPGLPLVPFKHCVGALLLQSPIIARVDEFLISPQRFGAVTALLKSLPCSLNSDFDANHSWQTLIRWFLFFLPGRYSQINSEYSEVFIRTNT